MDIIVLLKQTPATESIIEIADDGASIKTGDVKWVMNPYDEFAVEEAIRIKEAHSGTVTILSVGTDKTVEAIRTALAMGADKGVLVNDPEAAGCDNLGVARILAHVIKDMPFDLIIAGQRAVDDDNYLVGPAVAEYLNIPHISMVVEQEIQDGKIACTRTLEGGVAVLETALPALLTTQRGLNDPRYTSLPGIMKAKKKPIDTRPLSETGTDPGDPLVTTAAMRLPPQRTAGQMIEGDTAADKAAALVKALREEAKVI